MKQRLSFLLCTVLVGVPMSVPGQGNESAQPIERENLMKALATKGLTEQRMIELVNLHKLKFEMTPSDADEMRKLGAGEALIAALWKNDAFEVKPGPPLTRDAIITLLQSSMPAPRVERIIESRKARLTLDSKTRQEILREGGTPALLGVILTNLQEDVPLPATVRAADPPKPAAPTPEEISRKYNELLAEAAKQIKASDYRRATELAEDAKKLDRTRPQAFSFAGQIWLYFRDHIPTARAEYADALERGGTIEFRVQHSDGVSRITRRHSTCSGKLLVSKESTRFKADHGPHELAFTDKQLKEIDRGGLGPLGGGVVVSLDRGGEKHQKETFFATREEDKKSEEELIIDMIKK